MVLQKSHASFRITLSPPPVHRVAADLFCMSSVSGGVGIRVSEVFGNFKRAGTQVSLYSSSILWGSRALVFSGIGSGASP